MQIAIIAIDTRGGVQPYVALAAGLDAAGHDTVLITPADLVELATAHGVRALPLSGQIRDGVAQVSEIAEADPITRLRLMRTGAAERTERWLKEALDHCSVDLLLAGVGGGSIGLAVAEALQRPFLSAHLQPLGPSTWEFPGPLFSSAPRVLWPISHWATAAGLSALSGPGLARARRTVAGLPSRPTTTPVGTIYGYSPTVLPPPSRWGPRRIVTGYWTAGTPADWTPPKDLLDFLDAGTPPMCIGFGSMVSADPEGLARLVVDATVRAGVRAVLLTGWGGLRLEIPGDQTYVLDQAPHEWLFARTGGVVHHGGAGTTAAGLRAGVPTLVVPFAADQPFWGSRVAALGAGPNPIPRRRLTAAALADGLVRLDEHRSRAAEVGRRLRTEDGVGRAVSAVSWLTNT